MLASKGTLSVNPRIHPDGLQSVRDAAKGMGAGLMLWIEPERIVKTAKFTKVHPELVFDAK